MSCKKEDKHTYNTSVWEWCLKNKICTRKFSFSKFRDWVVTKWNQQTNSRFVSGSCTNNFIFFHHFRAKKFRAKKLPKISCKVWNFEQKNYRKFEVNKITLHAFSLFTKMTYVLCCFTCLLTGSGKCSKILNGVSFWNCKCVSLLNENQTLINVINCTDPTLEWRNVTCITTKISTKIRWKRRVLLSRKNLNCRSEGGLTFRRVLLSGWSYFRGKSVLHTHPFVYTHTSKNEDLGWKFWIDSSN